MRIEYEDKEILVVYKEAGLPVQTGKTSRRDLVSMLKNHLAEHTEGAAAGGPYLGIVHRLDQPVEGLLVFAKTPESAAILSAQAASKQGRGQEKPRRKNDLADAEGMEKVYQAIVCLDSTSYPLAIEGMKKDVTLIDYLGRDRTSNMAYIAAEGEKDAKRAELVFRTRWIRESRALLEIRLLTGRHHQIRIQMAHAHMPLLGDRKYRDAESYSKEERGSHPDPLCLCAARLSFMHPAAKKRVTFCVSPSWLPMVSKDAIVNDK